MISETSGARYALLRCAAPNNVDDREQDDRAQKRRDQAGSAEIALVDGRHLDEWAEKPSAEHRSDDSDYHIEQNALTHAHDRARRPSEESPDHEHMKMFIRSLLAIALSFVILHPVDLSALYDGARTISSINAPASGYLRFSLCHYRM